MSNTVIQIKRSNTTGTPPGGSLQQAELAYSYQSGKLYIGSANGLDVIAIGGPAFLNKSNDTFAVVNSAYATVNAAYDMANTGVNEYASAAYDHANSVYEYANSYIQIESEGTEGYLQH